MVRCRVSRCDATDSSDEPPPVPSTVCGRYDIRGKLGSGSYGVVHLGHDTLLDDDVAVKFEWVSAKKGRRLLHEAKVLVSMAERAGVNGFPRVHWWGSEGNFNIMVMTRLGPSLEQLFKTSGRRFSVETTVMLAEQMLDRIEFVHSCGILHRDIKPHNFLIGLGESGKSQVYIMDFGLAKYYKDPRSGEHIPYVKKKGVTGTVRYTSLNVHRGMEPSRRDDLGAIGYVLMQFLHGRLPWQGITAKSTRTKQRRIGRKKEQTSHDDLGKGFPGEFATWLKYCDTLSFAQRPDYDYLRDLLSAVRSKHEFASADKVIWAASRETDPSHALRSGGSARGTAGAEERSRTPPSRCRRAIANANANYHIVDF